MTSSPACTFIRGTITAILGSRPERTLHSVPQQHFRHRARDRLCATCYTAKARDDKTVGRRFVLSRHSGDADKTIQHALAARAFKLNFQLIAFNLGNRAIAELGVKHPQANRDVASPLIAH